MFLYHFVALEKFYRIIWKLAWLVIILVNHDTRFQYTILVTRTYESNVLYVKSYQSVFFLDIFISFCSTSKYNQTIWKLIWSTIRLIDENSWLPSQSRHDIHMRIINYFRRPGYSPSNCNWANSTSKRFRAPYVTVLYKRNWIPRGGRFHRLSTPPPL